VGWKGGKEGEPKREGKDTGPTKFITTRPTLSHFVTDLNMQISYKSSLPKRIGLFPIKKT
jgi:hypothetical protein